MKTMYYGSGSILMTEKEVFEAWVFEAVLRDCSREEQKKLFDPKKMYEWLEYYLDNMCSYYEDDNGNQGMPDMRPYFPEIGENLVDAIKKQCAEIDEEE